LREIKRASLRGRSVVGVSPFEELKSLRCIKSAGTKPT